LHLSLLAPPAQRYHSTDRREIQQVLADTGWKAFPLRELVLQLFYLLVQTLYRPTTELGTLGVVPRREISKATFAVAVGLAHLGVLAQFGALISPPTPREALGPDAPVLQASIIVQQLDADTVPIPEVHMHPIKVGLNALQMVRFEDPDPLDISGVIGMSSAPQLAQAQLVDAETYAGRVGLPSGRCATVLLAIEVLRDGSVGEISVIRSSGSPAADSAAIEYAHFLRWTPGTVDHQARAMRIIFPITLSRST
jgi:TonB family protein